MWKIFESSIDLWSIYYMVYFEHNFLSAIFSCYLKPLIQYFIDFFLLSMSSILQCTILKWLVPKQKKISKQWFYLHRIYRLGIILLETSNDNMKYLIKSKNIRCKGLLYSWLKSDQLEGQLFDMDCLVSKGSIIY